MVPYLPKPGAPIQGGADVNLVLKIGKVRRFRF